MLPDAPSQGSTPHRMDDEVRPRSDRADERDTTGTAMTVMGMAMRAGWGGLGLSAVSMLLLIAVGLGDAAGYYFCGIIGGAAITLLAFIVGICCVRPMVFNRSQGLMLLSLFLCCLIPCTLVGLVIYAITHMGII